MRVLDPCPKAFEAVGLRREAEGLRASQEARLLSTGPVALCLGLPDMHFTPRPAHIKGTPP